MRAQLRKVCCSVQHPYTLTSQVKTALNLKLVALAPRSTTTLSCSGSVVFLATRSFRHMKAFRTRKLICSNLKTAWGVTLLVTLLMMEQVVALLCDARLPTKLRIPKILKSTCLICQTSSPGCTSLTLPSTTLRASPVASFQSPTFVSISRRSRILGKVAISPSALAKFTTDAVAQLPTMMVSLAITANSI